MRKKKIEDRITKNSLIYLKKQRSEAAIEKYEDLCLLIMTLISPITILLLH